MRRSSLLVLVAVVLALTAAIACARLVTKAPPVETGQTAAELSLPDHRGGTVTLEGLTSRGPAVVVFYRGFW